MSSPDLWKRIHELYVRDIYFGLRLDSAGLHAWMTDRHFLRQADCDIEKAPGLVMAQDLQRWLEAEAPIATASDPASDVKVSRDSRGRRMPFQRKSMF